VPQVSTVILHPSDCAELAEFFSTQTHEPAADMLPRLTWLAQNPARRDDVPFAWGVRDAGGRLLGAMLCVPYRFVVGSRTEWFLMSSGFYVDAAVRGAGVQIFLRYRSLAGEFVLYASTANEQTAKLWQAAGGAPIRKTDYELLRPIRWAPVVEDVVARRFGPAARLVAAAARPFDAMLAGRRRRGPDEYLSEVANPSDAAVASGSGEAPEVVRDADFLRWRYVQAPHTEARLYRFAAPPLKADGFVAVTTARRGYRSQVRCLYVADVWGRVPSEAFPTLLGSLADRHASSADLIALRSLPDAYEAAARRAGFLSRPFACPVGWSIDQRHVLGEGWRLPAAGSELV